MLITMSYTLARLYSHNLILYRLSIIYHNHKKFLCRQPFQYLHENKLNFYSSPYGTGTLTNPIREPVWCLIRGNNCFFA